MVHFGLLVGVILPVFVHTLYSTLIRSSLLMIISNALVRVATKFSFDLLFFWLKDG